MRALKASLVVVVAVAALTSILGFTASAGASGCYIKTSARYPTVTSPCNKATVTAGSKVTFTVRDLNASAGRNRPYFNLSKKAPRHGRLADDSSGNGVYARMSPVKGRHGVYRLTPHAYSFPGYWSVTPGKYYIQVQQIESGCPEKGCTVYSPVTTINVK